MLQQDEQVSLPDKLECGDLNIPAPPGASLPRDQLSQGSELPLRLLPNWRVVSVPSPQGNCPIGSGSRDYSLCGILSFQEGKGSDAREDRGRSQFQLGNRASVHGVQAQFFSRTGRDVPLRLPLAGKSRHEV